MLINDVNAIISVPLADNFTENEFTKVAELEITPTACITLVALMKINQVNNIKVDANPAVSSLPVSSVVVK